MPATTSPFFGINYGWTTGESGWGAPVNSNFKVLSFLGKGAVDSFVGALPGSPSEGDSVVLTTDNKFYVRIGGAWLFIQPQEGQEINEVSTGKRWQYGVSWTEIASTESLKARVEDLEQFDTDLANAIDPSKGAAKIGAVRTSLATAIDGTISKRLSQLQVDVWEFSHLVTSKPTPSDPDTWDWTPAINAAIDSVRLSTTPRGVITFGRGGTYIASQIRLYRGILLDGKAVAQTEIKMLSGSSLTLLISENFETLTGTATTVASGTVPSWFGLRDIRIDGNKVSGATGRLTQWYGPAQLMLGVVRFGNCGNLNEAVWTEDANAATDIDWTAQEEGNFDKVFVMDNAGVGWRCRGPHNNHAESIIAGRNGGTGFRNEEGATYGGGFDWIGMLHTYANGRSTIPASDDGCYLGGIARIGVMVTDGDNLTIAQNRVQINTYRCFNLGGQRDGLIVTGDDVVIDNMSGNLWASSVGKIGVQIIGERFKCSGMNINGAATDNEGVIVTGAFCQINGLQLANFSAATRTALHLNANKARIQGVIDNSATNFRYTAGANNSVELELSGNAGQVQVAGSTPGTTDRFSLRANGTAGAGGTQIRRGVQSAQFPMDITTPQTLTIAHGLLYTPSLPDISATLLVSSPTSTTFAMDYLQVIGTDATNVTVQVKLGTAGTAGTLGRVGIKGGF
jgi:hypothetical protein